MYNPDVTSTKILWMETLPWFITPYLHTMTAAWAGSSGGEFIIHPFTFAVSRACLFFFTLRRFIEDHQLQGVGQFPT
jgi:hypothetical protein